MRSSKMHAKSRPFFENLFAQNTFVDKREDFTKQKKKTIEREDMKEEFGRRASEW